MGSECNLIRSFQNLVDAQCIQLIESTVEARGLDAHHDVQVLKLTLFFGRYSDEASLFERKLPLVQLYNLCLEGVFAGHPAVQAVVDLLLTAVAYFPKEDLHSHELMIRMRLVDLDAAEVQFDLIQVGHVRG